MAITWEAGNPPTGAYRNSAVYCQLARAINNREEVAGDTPTPWLSADSSGGLGTYPADNALAGYNHTWNPLETLDRFVTEMFQALNNITGYEDSNGDPVQPNLTAPTEIIEYQAAIKNARDVIDTMQRRAKTITRDPAVSIEKWGYSKEFLCADDLPGESLFDCPGTPDNTWLNNWSDYCDEYVIPCGASGDLDSNGEADISASWQGLLSGINSHPRAFHWNSLRAQVVLHFDTGADVGRDGPRYDIELRKFDDFEVYVEIFDTEDVSDKSPSFQKADSVKPADVDLEFAMGFTTQSLYNSPTCGSMPSDLVSETWTENDAPLGGFNSPLNDSEIVNSASGPFPLSSLSDGGAYLAFSFDARSNSADAWDYLITNAPSRSCPTQANEVYQVARASVWAPGFVPDDPNNNPDGLYPWEIFFRYDTPPSDQQPS